MFNIAFEMNQIDGRWHSRCEDGEMGTNDERNLLLRLQVSAYSTIHRWKNGCTLHQYNAANSFDGGHRYGFLALFLSNMHQFNRPLGIFFRCFCSSSLPRTDTNQFEFHVRRECCDTALFILLHFIVDCICLHG